MATDQLKGLIIAHVADNVEAAMRVAGYSGELKPDGNNLVGLCPFHADTHPSFKVLARDNGQWRAGHYKCFSCHATGDIFDLYAHYHGLQLPSQFNEAKDRLAEALGLSGYKPTRGRPRIERVSRWTICDANGKPVAEHIRTDLANGKKKFTWQRNGKSGLQGLSSKAVPLYGIQDVNGGTVVVCEGEKSADSLIARGLSAVGTVCGATAIPDDEVLAPLVDCDAVLWPDNDEAGHDHMRQIGVRLLELGGSPRLVEWEKAPEKGDAADWDGTDDELKTLLADARPIVAEDKPPPTIIANRRYLNELRAEALGALEGTELFVRIGAPVRIAVDEDDRPRVTALTEGHLRGLLSDRAKWRYIGRNGEPEPCSPPKEVAQDILSMGSWPWPGLANIIEAPTLRADGSVLQAPGYDQQSRLYLVPSVEVPAISDVPTGEELADALQLIQEPFADFPFADNASKAHAFALLFTALLRHAIPGAVPLVLINAPQARTGKSLLANVVSLIATGREAPMEGAPSSEDEFDKRILTLLLSGRTFVCFDNLERDLKSHHLAMAITAQHYGGRILGQSEEAQVAVRVTWCGTGNGITLAGDLPWRVLWVRLDAKTYRPAERSGFRHDRLPEWIRENRGRLLWAALTLARGWYAYGCPRPEGIVRWGGFDQWQHIIGGILQTACILGFCSDLRDTWEEADSDGSAWTVFLEAWLRNVGSGYYTVAEVIKAAHECEQSGMPEFIEQFPPECIDLKTGRPNSRKLGKALSKRNGQRLDEHGLRVEKSRFGDDHGKTARWGVLRG